MLCENCPLTLRPFMKVQYHLCRGYKRTSENHSAMAAKKREGKALKIVRSNKHGGITS